MVELHNTEVNRVKFVRVTTEFRNFYTVALASPATYIDLWANEISYVEGASE